MVHAAQGHPDPYSESRDWIQVEVQFFFLHTIAILSYVPLRLGMICRDAARLVVCQGQASMEDTTLTAADAILIDRGIVWKSCKLCLNGNKVVKVL